MSVFWITLKGMFFTALTAAISENLVFVRAFGMGELDYEEFTPRRALEEGYIVSLMSVLAAASGWLGRWLVGEYLHLPNYLQPPVFLGIFTAFFLVIMMGVLMCHMFLSGAKSRGRKPAKSGISSIQPSPLASCPWGCCWLPALGPAAWGRPFGPPWGLAAAMFWRCSSAGPSGSAWTFAISPKPSGVRPFCLSTWGCCPWRFLAWWDTSWLCKSYPKCRIYIE